MTDIQTEEDVKQLVESFYRQVQSDEVIGHFFADPAHFSWDSHIPRMVHFWSAILLGKPGFKGNAMEKHLTLHARMPLETHHFQHWLQLWHSTVTNLFDGPTALEAIKRAEQIARLLHHKVQPTAGAAF